MKTKRETFIYEGLGFPVELIDCPMKEVVGEWVLDINIMALQRFVFRGLIHKPTPLTGKEMRFMRKFLGLSTVDLGKKLGVSHAAVVKWEKEDSKISPSQEAYARLIFCKLFQGSELEKLFTEVTAELLAKEANSETSTIKVPARDLAAANF
ncbi:MAG: hypothetical protein KGI80_05780 [Verrucomicrobiota bacterium]|nr:hypothetical protein [Verrucomicrobiota bacterium]